MIHFAPFFVSPTFIGRAVQKALLHPFVLIRGVSTYTIRISKQTKCEHNSGRDLSSLVSSSVALPQKLHRLKRSVDNFIAFFQKQF